MMEPRSFAEVAPVGELTPIDLDALEPAERDRALYRAVIQTHACIESHRKEQTVFNAQLSLAHIEATEKRQALADDVLKVKGDVFDIKTSVGSLANSLGGQIQAGTVKIKTKVGWADLMKFAGAAGGALALVIFLVQLLVHTGPSIGNFWAAVIAYIMGLDPV
jgi:phage-related tail protein